MSFAAQYYRTTVLLTLVLAIPSTALGQQHLSTLRGVLLDAASRPAAGVRMRIISEATSETRRFTSDDEGRFVLLQLEPGTYRVEADEDRYREFVARVGVRVDNDQSVTLLLAAETISATSDYRPFILPIDEASPAVRMRLPGSFIADLPLDGRSVLDVALFAPAITSTQYGPVGSGTAPGFTGHLLDGFYNTEPLLGTAAVRPQIESVSEVGVTRASHDAALGRTGGSQIQVTSRSGTNTISGGGFAFVQTAAERRQFGGFAGGPLVENQTFLFADYQHTRFDELGPFQSAGHDLGGRVDHLFGGGARLMTRYGLSDGTALGRRAQHFGTSVTYAPGGPVANDVRFSVARVRFAPIADLSGIAESQTYQLSDMVSWTRGPHLVKAGGEWYAFTRGLASEEFAAHVLSGFVQDDWRPRADLSISGGLRFGRVSRNDAAVDAQTFVAPRAGVVWTLRGEQDTAIRGAYGRSHHPDLAFGTIPLFDHWTVGVERQWGRTRILEAAYVGSRGEDLPARGSSRYDAIVLALEQRFETGLTAYVAYTLGKWTREDFAGGGRSPFDARHKWTGAFTWSLPIGDERALFSEGLLGEVLEDMLITGTLATLRGRPVPADGGDGASYKTLNLALLKNWRIDLQRTLQLRFETFNALNRSNPLRAFFVPEPFEPFAVEHRGRRYQFGVRFVF